MAARGLEGGQSILPKDRRGCPGDYCRRCATGHLRVCVSRQPTGMTVESPGQGWCHTMRNVPGPGERRKNSFSATIDRQGPVRKKNKTAPSRCVNGADHSRSIDSFTPAISAPVCAVLVSARRKDPRTAVRLPSNTGGAAHSSLPACPKHAQLRCVPCRRPGNIPREARFSGLPGSEAAHRQDLGLDARPRTLYRLRFLRTYAVALRFVSHGCMCK